MNKMHNIINRVPTPLTIIPCDYHNPPQLQKLLKRLQNVHKSCHHNTIYSGLSLSPFAINLLYEIAAICNIQRGNVHHYINKEAVINPFPVVGA